MALPKIITSNVGRCLYKITNHPIKIVKHKIEQFFGFNCFDHLNHESSIRKNFDLLFVPLMHSVRSSSDTFYLNESFVKDFSFVHDYYYTRLETLNPFFKYFLADIFLNHGNIKVMQTHMTAHLPELLIRNYRNGIYTGTVYRKDEIDKIHFPIFHQTDGFFIKSDSFEVEQELKMQLEQLMTKLFSTKEPVQLHWDQDTSFPFTNPSFELYVKKKSDDKWTEVVGCGSIKKEVLFASMRETEIENEIRQEIKKWDPNLHLYISKKKERKNSEEIEKEDEKKIWFDKLCNPILNKKIEYKIEEMMKAFPWRGWAFGIGLDRLVMLLFNIPDIRLLWGNDERFIKQFKEYEINHFQPFSNFPPIQKDISFFVKESFKENAFFNLCREVANDYIEEVKKIDEYQDPKSNKTSVCYRIVYRSHTKTLTHHMVNELQNKIIKELIQMSNIQIR